MTDNTHSGGQPNGALDAPPNDGGNVDKIRDILFGSQMRDYDRRFADTEQRLQGESANLRDDLDSTRIVAHWEPYVALRPEFVLRRAGAALHPPPTVQLVMHADTLAATGVAPAEWLVNTRRIATALSGVGALDLSAVRDSAEVAMRAHADSLERLHIVFDRGASFPRGDFRTVVDEMATGLRRLARDAAVTQREVAVEVQATTDSAGLSATNQALGVERARNLRQLLLTRGVAADRLTVTARSFQSERHAFLRIAFQPLRQSPP